MKTVLLLLAAYALGSLSPAYALCRALRGCDLRSADSGNLGARNAGRVLGTWAGVLVLVLDGAKGYAAVALATAVGAPVWLAATCGAVSVAGHIWPFYLGFRGGRGAATVAGAALALLPIEMGIGLLVCLIILRTAGSLYIGGLTAVALSVVLALVLSRSGARALSPIVISLPLILRHIQDIALHVRDRKRPIP